MAAPIRIFGVPFTISILLLSSVTTSWAQSTQQMVTAAALDKVGISRDALVDSCNREAAKIKSQTIAKCMTDILNSQGNATICGVSGNSGIAAVERYAATVADYNRQTCLAANSDEDSLSNNTEGIKGATTSQGLSAVPVPKSNPAVASVAKPTVKPAPTAAASTTPSTPQEPSTAQQSANSDLNICQASLSQAQQCCNNPSSCVSVSTASTPTSCSGAEDCSRVNAQLSAASAEANKQYGAVCMAKETACQNTCGELSRKYKQLAASDSASSSIYQSTASTLDGRTQTCANLASVASNMGTQSVSNSGVGDMSGLISALTGSGETQSQDTASAVTDICSTNPSSTACQSCSLNPNSAECKALAQAAQSTNVASGGFSKPAASMKAGDFNVSDVSSSVGATPQFGATAQAQAMQNAQVVANNAGGGIPGSGGGSGSPASLGGPTGAARPSAGNPGYTTDVLQSGFQGGGGGGGYVPQTSGSGFEDSAPTDGRRRNPRALNRGLATTGAAANGGVDLKKYLPGGIYDPARRMGGMNNGNGIMGRFESMWQHISDRYREKCRLGVLTDCR